MDTNREETRRSSALHPPEFHEQAYQRSSHGGRYDAKEGSQKDEQPVRRIENDSERPRLNRFRVTPSKKVDPQNQQGTQGKSELGPQFNPKIVLGE